MLLVKPEAWTSPPKFNKAMPARRCPEAVSSMVPSATRIAPWVFNSVLAADFWRVVVISPA